MDVDDTDISRFDVTIPEPGGRARHFLMPFLEKEDFDMLYACQASEMARGPICSSVYVWGEEIDAYDFHLAVLSTGGFSNVSQRNVWHIVADKLGFLGSVSETENQIADAADVLSTSKKSKKKKKKGKTTAGAPVLSNPSTAKPEIPPNVQNPIPSEITGSSGYDPEFLEDLAASYEELLVWFDDVFIMWLYRVAPKVDTSWFVPYNDDTFTYCLDWLLNQYSKKDSKAVPEGESGKPGESICSNEDAQEKNIVESSVGDDAVSSPPLCFDEGLQEENRAVEHLEQPKENDDKRSPESGNAQIPAASDERPQTPDIKQTVPLCMSQLACLAHLSAADLRLEKQLNNSVVQFIDDNRLQLRYLDVFATRLEKFRQDVEQIEEAGKAEMSGETERMWEENAKRIREVQKGERERRRHSGSTEGVVCLS